MLASVRCTPLLVIVAAGLLIGDAAGPSADVLRPALLATAAAAACLLLVTSEPAWRRLAAAALAFTLGHAAAAHVYRPTFPADHVANAPLHVTLPLEATLTADPEINDERARLRLAVTRMQTESGWRPARGQVLLTVWQLRSNWYAGDQVRLHAALRRPRNFGNPGEFDYEGYLARQGIYVTAFVADDADFERVGHTGGPIAEWLRGWRGGVAALFRRTLPEPQAAVLSALIVGTQTALPRGLRAAFSRAGVSHVLSISGLHVGLVAAAGYALSRWLLARSRRLLLTVNVPKLAGGLSLVPVLLYAGIAGSNVATARSVIMIVVFVAAVLVDRQRDLIVSLAVAAIAILLYSPGAALDISFQLSFLAVFGLLLGLERFWPWWRRWEEARLVRLRGWTARLWRPLAVYVAVSVSALAATAPLTALHFNQVSLVAPVANAVVVPLLGSAAVVLGLLAALLYGVSETLAQACVVVAGPCVALGLWLVQVCAAIPYAALRIVTPTLLELALLYAALFALVRMSGRVRVSSLAFLGLLALGDGAWWYADRYHRSNLRVTFLSVGQGDSAVIEFPGADVMVVDGGGLGGDSFDVGERVIAPFLWSRKIGRVDYLVLSHPEWDHYGGLGFLAANFSPREFWSNGTSAPSMRFSDLQWQLLEHGVQRVALHRGTQRHIGAVDVIVQAPPQQREGLSVNNQSLVLSLAFGGTRVLFTGDIEAPAEDELVASADGTLASAVLKVPHHGSHTSSSPRFLDVVAPRLAVVSDGFENRFGFPHDDVVARYAAHHCRLARTDLDGAVRVRIGAEGTIEARTQRGDIDHRFTARPEERTAHAER